MLNKPSSLQQLLLGPPHQLACPRRASGRLTWEAPLLVGSLVTLTSVSKLLVILMVFCLTKVMLLLEKRR